MAHYGEAPSYYADQRPPYSERPSYGYGEQPPYGERPPYGDRPSYGGERPPYDRPSYDRPPYEDQRPPYAGGERSYGSPSPYGAPPPPSARPPAIPPPPLPYGWVQEWEPSTRRAFFVETATGRSQWEAPIADSEYGSRDLPPPGGGYYGGAPPGESGYPPHGGEGYPPPEGYSEHKEKKEKGLSDNAKMAMMGAGGLAVGVGVGALVAHELGKFFFSFPFPFTS